MSQHSVAEARNQLSSLIDRALAGEDVTITRHGRPVVELRPLQPVSRAVSGADLDWLSAHRVAVSLGDVDARELVRRMRDEDWR